jgi:tetratricopeptide (TPR) repeat protein
LEEKLGELLHLTTQYPDARSAYQAALLTVPLPDLITRARLTYKIANTWREQHEYERALGIYDGALRILTEGRLGFDDLDQNMLAESNDMADACSLWQCWIQIHIEKLSLLYWLAMINESEIIIKKIKPIVEKFGTPVQQAGYYRTLAAHCLRRDRYYAPQESVKFSRTALEAFQAAGSQENIPSVRFMYGMALMLIGELDQAEEQFKISLQLSEQRGDLTLQVRCHNYSTILYRQKGDVEKVEELAKMTLSSAIVAHMPEYMGAARGNLAWVAWRRGMNNATSEHAQAALSLWMQSPGIQSAAVPYCWTAVWPLIGVTLANRNLPEAVRLARTLTDPSQAGMPDELEKSINDACSAWDNGEVDLAAEKMNQALDVAGMYHYI